jgi:hypothetical protein
MVRVFGASQSDIIDRSGRLLGQSSLRSVSSGPADGDTNIGGNVVDQNDSAARIKAIPYAFNASTWDRIRNLQAGAPKFGLQIGDPRYGALYGTKYYGFGDKARAVAAASQFNAYRLRNPGASGVTVVIHYVSVRFSGAKPFAVNAVQTGASDRGTAIVTGANKKSSGSPTGAAVLSVDANVAANLANPAHEELLQAAVVREYREPIRLAAGDFVDFSAGDTTDAGTEVADFSIEWSEE